MLMSSKSLTNVLLFCSYLNVAFNQISLIVIKHSNRSKRNERKRQNILDSLLRATLLQFVFRLKYLNNENDSRKEIKVTGNNRSRIVVVVINV